MKVCIETVDVAITRSRVFQYSMPTCVFFNLFSDISPKYPQMTPTPHTPGNLRPPSHQPHKFEI